MSETNSRREFLFQGVPALGLLAWAGQQQPARASRGGDDNDTAKASPGSSTDARKLTERGLAFLRPRRMPRGGGRPSASPESRRL